MTRYNSPSNTEPPQHFLSVLLHSFLYDTKQKDGPSLLPSLLLGAIHQLFLSRWLRFWLWSLRVVLYVIGLWLGVSCITADLISYHASTAEQIRYAAKLFPYSRVIRQRDQIYGGR